MLEYVRNEGHDAGIIERAGGIISRRAEELRGAGGGYSFRQEEISFEVLQVEGNIVISCSAGSGPAFIAKYPATGSYVQIEHEAAQWKYLTGLSGQHPRWVVPNLVAFDPETKMVVLEKLAGTTAYRATRLQPLRWFAPWKTPDLVRHFRDLGEVLGCLHVAPAPTDLPAMLEPAGARLKALARRSLDDEVFARGVEHFEGRHQPGCEKRCWVHGNLKGNNVMFGPRGVALVDLERSGAGSAMGDLGRLLAFVLMFRKVRVYSRRSWESIVTAVVSGYASFGDIEPEGLALAMLAEVLHTYGRYWVLPALSPVHRMIKPRLRRIAGHLTDLCKHSPDVILSRPAALVC